MSHKTSARMYVGVRRGQHLEVATTHQHGQIVTQMGFTALKCRSAEPPAAAIYEDWLKGQLHAGPRGQHGKTNVTGEKLRRAVRMVRNGYSRAEACKLNGIGRQWLDNKLPPELAP